jgi:hypothetical protein
MSVDQINSTSRYAGLKPPENLVVRESSKGPRSIRKDITAFPA